MVSEGSPPAQPVRRPSNVAFWVVFGIMAYFLVSFVPFALIGFAMGEGRMGWLAILPMAVLAILIVTAAALAQGRNQPGRPVRPGYPAPIGSPMYGLPRTGPNWYSLRDRLRDLPARLRSLHVGILWGLVGLVALAGVGILAGILAGPVGTGAAGAGVILVVGWVVTVAAYFACGYRTFVPFAIALFLFGVLLHADAVAQAWDLHPRWQTEALLLLAFLSLPVALPAEAAFRRLHPPLWAVWAMLGFAAAAALPLWLFVNGDMGGWEPIGQIVAGLAVGSLAWCAAAAFAFPRIPSSLRWTGVAIFGLWAAAITAAFGWPGDLTERLQAAAFVAAAIVAAVSVTAYFVLRPRGAPA